MRMLAAVIDIEIVEQTGADTVLGKHTLYDLGVERMMAVGTHLEALIHQNLGSKFALAAGVACVAQIDAVCKLVASHSDLVGIDDDYIVAAVHIRSVIGLVFATQDLATFAQRRPRTWSVASTTTHSFLIVAGVAERVL